MKLLTHFSAKLNNLLTILLVISLLSITEERIYKKIKTPLNNINEKLFWDINTTYSNRSFWLNGNGDDYYEDIQQDSDMDVLNCLHCTSLRSGDCASGNLEPAPCSNTGENNTYCFTYTIKMPNIKRIIFRDCTPIKIKNSCRTQHFDDQIVQLCFWTCSTSGCNNVNIEKLITHTTNSNSIIQSFDKLYYIIYFVFCLSFLSINNMIL